MRECREISCSYSTTSSNSSSLSLGPRFAHLESPSLVLTVIRQSEAHRLKQKTSSSANHSSVLIFSSLPQLFPMYSSDSSPRGSLPDIRPDTFFSWWWDEEGAPPRVEKWSEIEPNYCDIRCNSKVTVNGRHLCSFLG